MPSSLYPTALLVRTAVLVLVMALSSCATPKEKKLLQDGITLQYIPTNSKVPELGKIRLDHPVRITEEQVRNHLLSLYYEELSLFGRKTPVYTQKDADRISHLLARAFGQVNSGNIISYKIKTPHGRTEGDTFISHNKINWRFTTIRDLAYVKSNSSNVRWTLASLWRLVPGKGQRIYKTKQFIGKKKWNNWIVTNLEPSPAQNRISKKKNKTVQRKKESRSKNFFSYPQKNSSPQYFLKSRPELEEKLKFLKNLRAKDLIDEKEFERKRKELLDRFL